VDFDSVRTCVCQRYKVCAVYIIGVRQHDIVFVEWEFVSALVAI